MFGLRLPGLKRAALTIRDDPNRLPSLADMRMALHLAPMRREARERARQATVLFLDSLEGAPSPQED